MNRGTEADRSQLKVHALEIRQSNEDSNPFGVRSPNLDVLSGLHDLTGRNDDLVSRRNLFVVT